MAPIKFKVVGARNIAAELVAFGPKIVSETDAAAKKGALRVANRIVKLLSKGSRSGRLYIRPGGRTHRASAAGEPPKSDSGFLAKSVKATTTKAGESVVSASVIISASYAGFLEKGTSKMAPRPYVAPSFALEAPAITRDMARAIKRAL